MIFPYGQTELNHLRAADGRLGWAIDHIGPIRRRMEPDLFASLVRSVVGQQISTAAQRTVMSRFQGEFPQLSAQAVAAADLERLQSLGISWRKAEYIFGLAETVAQGRLDLEALRQMPDEEVVQALTAVRGIGEWTAQMTLIFSLGRPDVLSYKDLGIRRGMSKLYDLAAIDEETFACYQQKYSPYGTTASLYLWAVAGGLLDQDEKQLPTGR